MKNTATTEIYTLSLHDALPISSASRTARPCLRPSSDSSTRTPTTPTTASSSAPCAGCPDASPPSPAPRSEEHTSELQSQSNLVCRPLHEKKNTIYVRYYANH